MKNLLVAGWSFTKTCNLKCMHCYNTSGKPSPDELSLEQAINVADKLKNSGVVAVNFGGGECALRKDFIPLVEYLKKLDMKISYTTNGTKAVWERLEPHLYLFDDIGVSLDFADAQKHNWFRGKPGTFEEAVSTLEKLVAKGIDTEIVTCLTKLNCSVDELNNMYSLAKQIGVNYWRLNRFRTNGRGIYNNDFLALSKQELKTAYKFLSKYVDNSVSVPEPLFRSAHGGRYFREGDPSGYTAFRIQPNGEVYYRYHRKDQRGEWGRIMRED